MTSISASTSASSTALASTSTSTTSASASSAATTSAIKTSGELMMDSSASSVSGNGSNLNIVGGTIGKGLVLPADHILFRLLGDFKELTKVKMDIFIRDEKIKMEEFFDASDSKTFNNVLDGLTEVSKYYLNLVSGALLQWRSTQHVIPARTISKQKLDGSDTKNLVAALEERHKLIVDYIFCIAMLTVLSSLTKDNLNDMIGTQIESICFENFKAERRATGAASPTLIPDLCAAILGQLSKYRLRSVSTRFFKEVQLCLTSNTLKSKIFPIFQGVRFLKLKLKQSLEFVTSCLDLFKNAKVKGDMRRALAEVLASVLRPMTSVRFKPDVGYGEWNIVVKELYDFVSKKTKNTKDVITTYPLTAVLLCVSDRETFLKSSWTLIDGFIKIKDKQVRPYALEASQYLLECYLHKHTEQPEEVSERLHQFIAHVFPASHTKKLTLSASDSLHIFIDIIGVIASTMLEFSFEKVIFDLLRGGDLKDSLGYISNPERMIVGLRAVQLIVQASSNGNTGNNNNINNIHSHHGNPLTPKTLAFVSNPGGSGSSTSINQSSHAATYEGAVAITSNKVLARRYRTLHTKGAVAGTTALIIEPYSKSLSIFLSHMLSALDASFGMLLSTIQTKPLSELLEKMRPPGPLCLELLKVAIATIPIAFPSKITVSELVLMLSKYLIHLDKGISEKSSAVLTQLMATRPDLRPNIIGGLGKYALSISDKQSHFMCVVLEKMAELLGMWAAAKTNRFQMGADDVVPASAEQQVRFRVDGPDYAPDVDYIEAVGLVCLCSSSARNKRVSLSILGSIAIIHEAFQMARIDEDIEITIHIKDIIDENGNEYLYRHAQSLTHQFENKYKKQKSPHDFERLADAETKEAQMLWSACLSDIARAASELATNSVAKACELVLQRIKPIQPEESGKTQSGAPEVEAPLSTWWKNYIVFACATIAVPENETKKTEQWPVCARELFTLIIPYLKSADKFFVESTVMALQKTNARVLDVLCDQLRPWEHELHTNKKSKKRLDGMRSVIGIRRHCLESLRNDGLVKREQLKRSYIDYIQEVLQFLLSPESNTGDYIWDSLHGIRFNLCVLVHRMVQQLYFGANEFLDKNMRRELFKLFSKWSESEEQLRDEPMLRRLAVFLQQEEKEVTKRKEYEIRIFEQAAQLSNVALHAVSLILLGPPCVEAFKEPTGFVFQWINSMFTSKMKTKIRSVSRQALQSFLKCNAAQYQELIYHCINQCYSLTPSVASNYFLALVDMCQDGVLRFPYSESILTNLIIYNAGAPVSAVRQSALQLLYFFKASSSPNDHYTDGFYPSAIGSEFVDTYRNAQLSLSKTLALENPELCYELFLDVVYRLETGDSPAHLEQHQTLLACVAPWVEQMNLLHLGSANSALLDSVLQGFVLVTMKHAHLTQPIERLWRILGRIEDNVTIIVDFALKVIERTRNHGLLPVFTKICLFLGRSSPQKLVNSLVSELSATNAAAQSFTAEFDASKSLGKAGMSTISRAAIPPQPHEVYNTMASISRAFHTATVRSFDLTGGAKGFALTRLQTPLIFLSEISFEVGEEFREHLPVLLQLIFLGLHYNHQPVHEHCRMLLLNIIRSLVIRQQQQLGVPDPAVYEEAVQLVDFLLPAAFRSDETAATAAHSVAAKKEISNPKYVVMLSRRVVQVLSNGRADCELKEHWGANALNWATSSQNIRLAMRSYQIIRGLEPTTTVDALTEVIQCLGKKMADISVDNIGLINEILETLHVMIGRIHPSKLILFPQLMWGVLALMHTDFDAHYISAAKTLALLLDLINFNDRAVQNVFLASINKEWDFFNGVQPLAIRGLGSTTTFHASIDLLSKLTLKPCNEIFHPEPGTRFLANLMALLPYLCANIANPERDHLCYVAAERLSLAAENQDNCVALAQILYHFSRLGYARQLDRFLTDLSAPLCQLVGATRHSTLTFTLLFDILEHGPADYNYPTLKLLNALVAGGVNPADSKPPGTSVGDWYDTISNFINGHQTPAIIVAQALKFIEMSSQCSPASLQPASKDVAKSTDSLRAIAKQSGHSSRRFLNKVDRGTHMANVCLSKVLNMCHRPAINPLSKSMYFSSAQIIERFFSSSDDLQPPGTISKGLSYDDLHNDGDSEAAATSSQASEISVDEADHYGGSLHKSSSDLTFGGEGMMSEFHQFPHFQGFDDLLMGLDDLSTHEASTSETSSEMSNSTSSYSSTTSAPNQTPSTPLSKVHHSTTTAPMTPVSASPMTRSPSSVGRKLLANSSSPSSLSRGLQFHTNPALSALSHNVSAAKNVWTRCAEQTDLTAERDVFEAFAAASHLVQHISIEYRTLFSQFLSLITTTAAKGPTLAVEMFEKPPFSLSHQEILKTKEMSEKYRKDLALKPSTTRLFLEMREKAIAAYTQQLNVYTEQRTATNNVRAKLFESGSGSEVQIAEARFCAAMCSLYQQLLQLWTVNLSLQELLNDYSQLLAIDKQRDEIKKEMNKCKVTCCTTN
ncbi:hypothetical protein SAMD00019534_096750 [Acytostelium subglobosum LB1]|uniref:hypothetical protein n=1 Tax=Acytostelium subglobosum LB1 TaxID=1410327 RepID=UPI0006447EF1|nr:hypothetical protein SAMD00019534_096750 [Acytostelium subglobosum LB1]GAM26500.1 hypothetical protein SAMD00019534_096750 [Acytostelium subglobosum LB1]|eukprot:XP_012750596.1 hypothetical protein SAMD00019534_096750 [Acytostelium subglobosum LB1]